MKQLLIHDKQAENRFIQKIQAVPELLEEVKRELTAQKVDHKLKLSDLQNGEFIKHFNKYHEAQKNKFLADADYTKYLELCNVTIDKLAELENRYKKLLDIKHYFYTQNHDYWFSKETYEKNFERVSHPEAPTKKEYCIDDFLTISKDNFKVAVSPDLFKLYLTNEAQLKAMGIVTDQVKLCKRRNDKPADTIRVSGELVKDIDADYNITWNYNAILDIK